MCRSDKLRIRLVNRVDRCGGAEVVAQDQLREYRALGYDVELFVGQQRDPGSGAVQLPPQDEAWIDALQGADVVHFHNLHGGYFPEHVLPRLSHEAAVVVTLHDQFLFTGGCIHTGGCSRWKTGCGECPQMNPELWVDRTAEQWTRKRLLFQMCRLHVVAPARWIYDRARDSILNQGTTTFDHSPNGVDTRLFQRNSSREHGFDRETILLAIAKDWPLLQATVSVLSSELRTPSTLLVLGVDGVDVRQNRLTVQFLGHVTHRSRVAQLFASADIYIHPTRSETFSLSILEAMASGCAVVATDAGGIGEQLDPNGVNPRGIVVPVGNVPALVSAIDLLVSDESLRGRLASEAARYAAAEWSLTRHVDAHLHLYRRHLEAVRGRGACR